jgi:Tol biopolymer transport system component
MLTAVTNEPFDERRLRATLRLCFDARRADELAAHLAGGEIDPARALSSVVRLARLSYTTGRWFAPFNGRLKPGQDSLPLRPHPALPAISALALALHLGLELDVDTLARLFHLSPTNVALALQRARQHVDGEHLSPCPEFAARVGRYRDPSDDRIARLELLQHLDVCERCKLALEHARLSDDSLLGFVGRAEHGLAPLPSNRPADRSLWLAPVLFWGSMTLIAVLLVGVAFAGSRRLLAGRGDPVPLLAADRPPAPFSGWLLESSDAGAVDAVNLATGARRQLIPGEPNSSNSVTLSPDHQLIAFATSDPYNGGPSALRIYHLNGAPVHTLPLAAETDSSSPLGWLDARHFMVEEDPHPRAGETAEEFQARLPTEERVISIDVETGDSQVLITGAVNAVSPSPDGKYVAIDRMTVNGPSMLELRPLTTAGIGRPVASFTEPVSPAVWTPDSRGVAFFAATVGSIDLLDLNGRVTSLATLPTQDQFRPNAGLPTTVTERVDYAVLGIAPDGRRIIYAERTDVPVAHPLVYWELPLSGGSPRQLGESDEFATTQPLPSPPIWSPSGAYLALTLTQPFYLPYQEQGSTLSGVGSSSTITFDNQGKLLGAVSEGFSARSPIAWLPEEALPYRPANEALASDHFETQGTLKSLAGEPQLTGYSRLSPDGSAALYYDRVYDFSLSAPIAGGEPGQIEVAGAPLDPSWLPDSSGAIGVQQHDVQGGKISRIALYTTTRLGVQTPIDFDPAQLGVSTTATYHEPMLAPNGLHYSFFVVDRQRTTLWAGGYEQSPRVVATWTEPDNAKINPPLISAWVANDTLVFAEPGQWSGGQPQRVSLQRLTHAADGSSRVDTLHSWYTGGNETGIALQELRLSPGGSWLAFRLRHYRGAKGAGRVDSISVDGSADLTQSLELVRGSSGDGMSWSPDGSELVAAIKGGIWVMSSDGSGVVEIDAGQRVDSYPLWVLPNEIWYESGEGDNGQLLRATR